MWLSIGTYRPLILAVVVIAATVAAYSEPDTGLVRRTATIVRPGDFIVKCDFERCEPQTAVVPLAEADWGKDTGRKDCWALRHPGWTPALLNAIGNPPALTYDPGLKSTCDIYIGIRAVTPVMSFAVKLSSETEFTYVTAPAATETHHYDTEFFWKAHVPMDGEKIVIKSIGRPVYLQYFRFVPEETVTEHEWVATRHVTVCAEKGRHFAFPGITETANGDLLVVCREGEAHVCPFGRIVMVRSTDRGRSWAPRQVIYDSPSDDRDPSIHALPDGTLAVTFDTWNSWMASTALKTKYAAQTARIESDGMGRAYTGSWIITSRDNGTTWSKPTHTPVFSPHGPTVAPDGSLVYAGLESVGGDRFISVYRSTDHGLTWEYCGTVARIPLMSREMAEPVFDEPNLAVLPDGRWQVSARVQYDGLVRTSVSADGGRRWSWPRVLPIRGFPQYTLPLRDGRLLMTYGYRYAPLGVRGCLSADGGRTWDVADDLVFCDQGADTDLGYPVSIELGNGDVYTVYYYKQTGGDCYIEGTWYRPR